MSISINSKIWLSILVVLMLVALAYYVVNSNPTAEVRRAHYLPWQVSVSEGGDPRVFEIELGRDSTVDFLRTHRASIDIRLFVDPDGSKSLEAYISKIRLGLFDASIILLPRVSEEQLKQYQAAAIHASPGPSGARKIQLPEKYLKEIMSYPIDSLIYIPKVQYTKQEVTARFGAPHSRLELNESSSMWSYPDKSMLLILDSEEREKVYYVSGEQYDYSRDKIIQSHKKIK